MAARRFRFFIPSDSFLSAIHFLRFVLVRASSTDSRQCSRAFDSPQSSCLLPFVAFSVVISDLSFHFSLVQISGFAFYQ